MGEAGLYALGAISAPVVSILNTIGARKQNRENMAFQAQQQQIANDFASREAEKARNYNSPAHQLQLYQDAGMNPNLISGEDFVPTQSVQNQSVPNYSQPSPMQLESPDIGTLLQQRAQSKLLNEQSLSEKTMRGPNVRLADANFDYIVENTNHTREDIKMLSKKMYEIDETVKLIQEQVKYYNSLVNNVNADTSVKESQVDLNNELAKNEEYKRTTFYPMQLRQMASQIAVNTAQRSFLLANAKYFGQMARSVMFQNDVNQANKTYILQMPKLSYFQNLHSLHLTLTQEGMMKFQFGQLRSYSDLERMLNLASGSVNMLNGLFHLDPFSQTFDRLQKVGSLIPFSGGSSPQGSPSGYFNAPSYSY